jgi:TRAP-type mannitol/chloroaromatic compound transport system substrate-binding protein
MDRRSFFRNTGLAAAATALAAPAVAQDAPRIVWRMASYFPRSLKTIFAGAEEIAARVAAATDGAFEIQVKAPGDAVPADQILDAVRAGTVEAGFATTMDFWEKEPTFALATGLPFGLNSRMANAWFYQGNGKTLLADFLTSQGLHGLPAGNGGTQMGGWFRKDVGTLDDMKGLKFRISGLASKVLEKIGATPQQLATEDVYSALERNQIDAASHLGPLDDAALGLFRVAKYYYYPAFWNAGPVIHALFNLEKFKALPLRYQAILEDACASANSSMLARYDTQNPKALREIAASGTQLRPFTQDILDAAFAANNAICLDLSSKSPYFKKAYDDQMAFRKDAYMLTQVGDYTFDTFMVIQQRAGKL